MNSRANGLGWKFGGSLRWVAGDEVRDSGREGPWEEGVSLGVEEGAAGG